MGVIFYVLISVFSFVMIKAQCPTNSRDKTVSKCNGQVKSGIFISVDFNKINHPCTCIVVSMFAGDLLVLSRKGASTFCNSFASVNTKNKSLRLKCSEDVADTFPVHIYDTVIIKADYLHGNNSGDLDQCLEISENGDGVENISVTCGKLPDIDKTPEITFPSPSNPITKYIMAGTSVGGIVILFGLTFVLMLRKKNGKNDEKSMEVHRGHQDTSFNNNTREYAPDTQAASSQPQEIPLYLIQDPLSQTRETNPKHEVDTNIDLPKNHRPDEQALSATQLDTVQKNWEMCALENELNLRGAQVPV